MDVVGVDVLLGWLAQRLATRPAPNCWSRAARWVAKRPASTCDDACW